MTAVTAPSRSKFQQLVKSIAEVERRIFKLEQSGAKIPDHMNTLKETANNVALAVFVRQSAVEELSRKVGLLEEGMDIQSVTG